MWEMYDDCNYKLVIFRSHMVYYKLVGLMDCGCVIYVHFRKFDGWVKNVLLGNCIFCY
jgi:hypothetical protein